MPPVVGDDNGMCPDDVLQRTKGPVRLSSSRVRVSLQLRGDPHKASDGVGGLSPGTSTMTVCSSEKPERPLHAAADRVVSRLVDFARETRSSRATGVE